MLKVILSSVALLIVLVVVKWFFDLTFIGWLTLGTPALLVGSVAATALANVIDF